MVIGHFHLCWWSLSSPQWEPGGMTKLIKPCHQRKHCQWWCTFLQSCYLFVESVCNASPEKMAIRCASLTWSLLESLCCCNTTIPLCSYQVLAQTISSRLVWVALNESQGGVTKLIKPCYQRKRCQWWCTFLQSCYLFVESVCNASPDKMAIRCASLTWSLLESLCCSNTTIPLCSYQVLAQTTSSRLVWVALNESQGVWQNWSSLVIKENVANGDLLFEIAAWLWKVLAMHLLTKRPFIAQP
jgi:hypothetical protein